MSPTTTDEPDATGPLQAEGAPISATASDHLVACISEPPATLRSANHDVEVVVAEDEPITRRRLSDLLRTWGFRVTPVADGAEAVAILARDDAPRLALVDWEMPRLSGIDVCRILRRRRSLPYVYVIVLTDRTGARPSIDALAAGADDFVCKARLDEELEMRLRAGKRIVLLQEQLLAAQRELERRALYDSLTGVKNRGAVLEVLSNELARAHRRGHRVGLIMFDVDHFKRINDEHGHASGDAVLRELASRTKTALREYDTVGRYGGEEFVVVAPECGLVDAATIADRIRCGLAARPIQTPTGSVSVTASFGVASAGGLVPAHELLARADDALYAAKHAGRNRVKLAAIGGQEHSTAHSRRLGAPGPDVLAAMTVPTQPSIPPTLR